MVSARNGSDQEHRGEGLWDWNLESDLISYSPRWAAMLGLSEDDITSKPADWLSRVHPKDLGPLLAALREHWRGATEAFEMEYRVRCYDEAYRWMASRGVASRDEHGKAVRMVGSQIDISDTKMLDSLTGLFNQPSFVESLTSALKTTHDGGRGLAILVVEPGNHQLIEVADRLRVVSAKWRAGSEDRKNSIAVRLSETKFAVMLDGVSSPLQAVSIADEILKALRNELISSSETLRSRSSIGIALSGLMKSGRHPSAEDVLRNADAAMCSAKARDEDCWVLSDEP